MRTLIRTLALRFHGERATAVEYGPMIALIAMAIFGTVYRLGPDTAFDEVAASLG